MKYSEQARWFLNGFWRVGAEQETDNIWKFTMKFMELDPKKKEGNELDEFWSHKFLESLGETLTVIKLREELRKIDLDANGKMALLEYLAFRYSKTVLDIINAPQGDNQQQVQEAVERFERVQDALSNLVTKLEEQRIAEDALKKAETELKAAVEDLRKQEDEYHSQISSLEAKSQEGSTVSRNKAAAELSQLKSTDPLPLRKAKITQEAALRRTEKERKATEIAVQQVSEAVRDTEQKLAEAEKYLNEVKRQGGSAQGSIWFMERELKEAQKYLPKKKQV